MGLFRRTSRNANTDRLRSGSPIDPERYAEAVAEGPHPGLPLDGRYWLMRADTYADNETRLLWEKAATHREARRAPKAIGAEGRYHEALAAMGLPPDTELDES